jgi:hypothetical protein
MLFPGRLEEGVKAAGKLGSQSVELSLRVATDTQPDSLREMLAENGLVLSAIVSGEVCLFDSVCLTASEDALRAATAERSTGRASSPHPLTRMSSSEGYAGA